MSQIVFQKDWFAVFKVNVTVKDPLIKIWLSYISSGLLIILRLNLVWWHIIISWIVLWTHWITVKVTENVENSSECSSGRYLFNCWTFCNQTWYGDTSSWARVSCEKIGFAIFKVRVTMRAHIIRYDCFCHICWTADLFVTKFNWMVHHHRLECLV